MELGSPHLQGSSEEGTCNMDSLRGLPGTERRQPVNRRALPTTFWTALRVNGRRQGFRRVGEAYHAYVDCPSQRVTLLLFAVVICSVLDALCTLLFLERGGEEANPIMALAMSHGTVVFVALKMALTGFGAWFMAAHQHFAVAFKGLHVLAGGYALLLFIHAILLLS
jgi:hypothetical protein